MNLINTVNNILALGTILADLAIVLAVVYLLFFRKVHHVVVDFIETNGIFLAAFMALIATAGSLFYSQYAGFTPCDLCWFQRIFMYPLVVLLGLAVWKKDNKIIDYALPLAGIGFAVSLYQNYLYYFNQGLDALCLLGGSGGVSCVKRYVFELGYVTIPVMALTAFVVIILLLVFQKMADVRMKKV